MKRIVAVILVLVVLFCMAGCAANPTQSPAEDEPLKVISFNIQTHRNGEIFFVRTEMMKEFIDEMQPDSIGMQEVTPTWRKRLDETCFGDEYSSVGNADEGTGEMNAIFYRNDKFTLVDSGTFWLSDTPDVVGSEFEKSNYPRVCTWARLKNNATAKEFVHLNVHLDNKGSNTAAEARELRMEQGKVLLDFVKTLGSTPMIVTGDFNQVQQDADGNDYPLYQRLTDGAAGGPFADARTTAADTVSPTEWASMTQYHLEGERYNPAALPIDYIFYTAAHFEPMVYRNIMYVKDEIFTISDHLAQYAEFTVK